MPTRRNRIAHQEHRGADVATNPLGSLGGSYCNHSIRPTSGQTFPCDRNGFGRPRQRQMRPRVRYENRGDTAAHGSPDNHAGFRGVRHDDVRFNLVEQLIQGLRFAPHTLERIAIRSPLVFLNTYRAHRFRIRHVHCPPARSLKLSSGVRVPWHTCFNWLVDVQYSQPERERIDA